MAKILPHKFIPPIKFEGEVNRFIDLNGRDLHGAELRAALDSPMWKENATCLNLNSMQPLWAVGVARGRLRRSLTSMTHAEIERVPCYFCVTVRSSDGKLERFVIQGTLNDASAENDDGVTPLEEVLSNLIRKAMPVTTKRPRTPATVPEDAVALHAAKMKNVIVQSFSTQPGGPSKHELAEDLDTLVGNIQSGIVKRD